MGFYPEVGQRRPNFLCLRQYVGLSRATAFEFVEFRQELPLDTGVGGIALYFRKGANDARELIDIAATVVAEKQVQPEPKPLAQAEVLLEQGRRSLGDLATAMH